MQVADQPGPAPGAASAPAVHPPLAIELEGVVRRFDQVQALAGITMSVRKGEFFSLLGPSGCGKTTLLRVVAGLDVPDAGRVSIGGADMGAVPAHRRPVNTVFQSYALFPHMTVFDNVAFGLRMRGVPAGETADRVKRVLDLVEIGGMSGRRPAQLSGGQKQRVALARAVVNEPEVLLLDEPLGALDLKLRQQLQVELHRLQRRLGITFLYVTHDQDEALTMSDRIAVLNHGRIEQMGPSDQLYDRPRTRFVARFLGSCNLLEGTVRSREGSRALVDTPLGPLAVDGAAATARSGAPVTLAIRLERVALTPEPKPENCVAARIEDAVYAGAETQYRLSAGAGELRVRLLNSGPPGSHRAPGDPVTVHLPPDALVVLDD